MVHRRQVEVDGEVETLLFGVHGALWGNAMTWWDHSTGSVWTQIFGEALAGPRKGQKLDLLASQYTTWRAWRNQHPETLALAVDAGRSGFELQELWLVLDLGDDARAWPVADLRSAIVVNDVVGGVPVAAIIDPAEPDRWSIRSRRLPDGTVVELEADGDRLLDRVTGTAFDGATGRALSGSRTGETLAPLPTLTSFPGDFDTFWPEGSVWNR